MICKYIVEDSSFVIDLLNSRGCFHQQAVEAFKLMYSVRTRKMIVPSTVFYETMFVLLKQGASLELIRERLLKMMMVDNIIGFPIVETQVGRMAKYTKELIDSQPETEKTRANDLMIITIAMSQENSCLITADKGIKKYSGVYKNIFSYIDADDMLNFKKFLEEE
jgi:hypothetical protein